MSVLIPDLKVYNYIQAGIEKLVYNNVIDDFHSHSINRHFHNCPDIEKEAARLTLAWLELNQKSYNERYPNEKDNINLCGFYYQTTTHRPLTAIQLLKYLQCIEYNIEIEDESKDLQLLKDCINDLQNSIINNMEEYKNAKWSK